MDHLMTEVESYADRRRLFKDIWNTSINTDAKEDIMTKPKVIKTLRLGEVDRIVAKKKKKQKIKNLRTVCNKLLDFCDRQDADDLYYEQMAAGGRKSSTCSSTTVEPKKPKKLLKGKKRAKHITITKSWWNVPLEDITLARATTSEGEHTLPERDSRDSSPSKIKRTIIAESANKNQNKRKCTHLRLPTGNMNVYKRPYSNKQVLKMNTVNVNLVL